MTITFHEWATKPLTRRFGILMSLVPLVLVSPVQAAVGAAYDFERLEIRFLAGQDGWVSEPSLGEAVVRDDETAVNGTRVAQPDLGVASGFPGYFTRVNNAAFGFSLESVDYVTIQFDTTGAGDSAFGLGADVNGNGLLERNNSELGPAFGLSRDTRLEVAQFVIYPSGFATPVMTSLTSGNNPADWYRLQLHVDFVSGRGSLYFLNQSKGDTVFQPVSGLQNIDLGLGMLEFAARPGSWNAMWLMMQADGRQNTPKVDNLTPTASTGFCWDCLPNRGGWRATLH